MNRRIDTRRMRYRRTQMIAGVCVLIIGALLIGALGWFAASWHEQSNVYAVAEEEAAVNDTAAASPFPHVDWEKWKTANGSFIGWVSIPDTTVSLPIVQASAQDPDYYLEHDIYGNRNWFGCAYLDADCQLGWDALNCIVYAHNMEWDDSMFGPLENYIDEDWAWIHRSVLLQTTDGQRLQLTVCAADIISADTAEKHTSFADTDEFKDWWHSTFEESSMRLCDNPPAADRVYTFCTCAYQGGSNQRTLVYATAEPIGHRGDS